MRILMVAAENDALPGGKVGGIGDVIRDIPVALADSGQQVDVATPGYGAFSQLPGAEHAGDVQVYFAGFPQLVAIYRVPARNPCEAVTLWAFEHPLFSSCGTGRIYCDDGADRPFASDASKFALFSLAVCRAIDIGFFASIDVLHLHDWHAAMVAVLARLDPQFASVAKIHSVFTVHNLGLQGTRPLAGDDSSPERWFRHLSLTDLRIVDPEARNCINPMRAGINLCDRVHVVSPGYAGEIVKPCVPGSGLACGEGLHEDLERARVEGRLFGILNGCDYSSEPAGRLSLAELLALCDRETGVMAASETLAKPSHLLAWRAIDRISAKYASAEPPLVLTSVGRLTAQKVQLLVHNLADGRSALAHMLDALGERGILMMLGSGDPGLEQFMAGHAAAFDNFVYLQGYSDPLAKAMYTSGDLFVMPSSYEPCGISQMLAMRAGQPCFVHSVGGLRDTVVDGKTGFAFGGSNSAECVAAMLKRFDEVLTLHRSKPKQWQRIASSAAAVRFSWSQSAQAYIDKLYAH